MNNFTLGILKKYDVLNYTSHSNGFIEIFDMSAFRQIQKDCSMDYIKPKIMCNGEKIAMPRRLTNNQN